MKRITKNPSEKIVTDFKRTIRNHYSSEEKIRIMLDGLRGEVCRISSPSITVELSIIFMFAQKSKMCGLKGANECKCTIAPNL